MKRLTEWYYGSKIARMKCSVNCESDTACIDCPAFEKLVDRLAEYEDTGWIPEEIIPVVHGRLIEDDHTCPGAGRSNYKCTVCGKFVGTWKKGLTPAQLPNYCLWCGATFDKRHDDAPDNPADTGVVRCIQCVYAFRIGSALYCQMLYTQPISECRVYEEFSCGKGVKIGTDKGRNRP